MLGMAGETEAIGSGARAPDGTVGTAGTMRATVARRYGPPDVLHLEDVQIPTPGAGEVRVEVHAAGLNAADWHVLRADPPMVRLMGFGLLRPKDEIPGADVAGVVDAVGRNVTLVEPGDEVYGDLSACGHGAFAEYVCAPEDALAPKPSRLTFEEAAAVPLAGVTALQGLRDEGRLRRGQRVVITGASGGVGTFAVQVAKSLGAEVTGVCSTEKVDLVRSLGADHVVDYAREDFTQAEGRYDLLLDAGGYRSIRDCRRALRPDGTHVFVGGSTRRIFEAMLLGPLLSRGGGPTVRSLVASPDRDDLLDLSELVEAGDVSPAIDRRFPLARVPDAIRYLEAGRARGKVVVAVR